MFRRLRERLTEELEAQASRFPGGQQAFNNSPGGRSTDSTTKSQEEMSTEDLITLSDSSSVVVPHTSPQQFSIGDDDGFPSETSTPQKKQAGSDLDQYYTTNSSTEQQNTSLPEVQNILPIYTPSKKSFYVPQSDIESEVEEPPTLKLEGISMDQLSSSNEALKARLYKYKDKYSKIVQAYKEMHEEKKKIEHTLTECQDKALRRIAELREQCHLEQKAKAHLEENLRIYLEEKQDMINVLQTKIELLKEGRNTDTSEVPVQEKENPPDEGNKNEENLSGHTEDENLMLKDKVKKLQVLLEKCKETMVNSKEQMSQLVKEKESISQMLDAKTKEVEEMKVRESHSQSELEAKLKVLQSRLTELEQQQAESAMSMAETKKNMHEELEIKEQQLTKSKEDIKQLQHAVDHERHLSAEAKKQYEETVDRLQNKLKVTERMMEEEKQNLMQELSRGKAAAVALMQQECAKKLHAVEAEWKNRLKESEIQSEKSLHEKEKELSEVISQKETELQNLRHDFEKQRLTAEELERQNEKLNEAIENIKTKRLEDEKYGCLQFAEQTFKEEFEKLTDKFNLLEAEKAKFEMRAQEAERAKAEIYEKLEGLENELALQLQAKDKELEIVVSQKNQLHTDCSILQESVKDKENIILQLRSTVSSLEKDNQCKIEELNGRIKQLELEREQLMLQAQERVAATEAKRRQSINSLTEKVNELQSKEREIENLKSNIENLSSQLDESLIVAEANQSAASQELSILKAHLSASQTELENAVSSHSLREAELLKRVQSLEEDILLLQRDKKDLEALEAENVVLLEKVQGLEEKVKSDSPVSKDIFSLKEENERLQNEVDSLVALRKDNEVLVAKVHSLESNEKDLHERLNQLESTNAELRTSTSSNLKQTSDRDSSVSNVELTQLQNENRALLDKVRVLEDSVSKNSDTSFKEYIDLIKKDYEGKLSAKDAEMESRLKQIIKDFAAQMNVKEKDYDEILSQVLEKSQSQESKLLREHRLEIASLRQEIFEKDCALEEMHDHYEEIVKEKDAKLQELEKKHRAINPSTKQSLDPANMNNETSDWDDNWVECEENCDNTSPVLGNKGDCATHVHQIRMLQEELEKSNSEIKDLRVLLRLSPPQSLASNNDSKSSSLLLPEPTEFEYLRNILFEYMMGKEPLTLAKVIAAVLRFSDEQTKLVLKKEELKQTMK